MYKTSSVHLFMQSWDWEKICFCPFASQAEENCTYCSLLKTPASLNSHQGNCRQFCSEGSAALPSMSLYFWGHKMFSSLLCKLQTCRRISKPQMRMCSKESTMNQGNFQCLSAMPRLRATCSDDLKKQRFTVYLKKYKYPNFVSTKWKENSVLAQHLVVSSNYWY